jgi:hypothetical protein
VPEPAICHFQEATLMKKLLLVIDYQYDFVAADAN